MDALQLEASTLAALLFGTVRAAGFAVIAPPFAGSTMPRSAKTAFIFALALVMMGQLKDSVPTEVTGGFLVTTAITEAVIGFALGFIVYLLFAAVQFAGDIIDLVGGFSMQPGYDPLSQTQSGVIGRFHYLIGITLLFATGGHMMIVSGFAMSYSVLPIGADFPAANMAQIVIVGIGRMFLAAVQIAAPLIAVLLLVDFALALMSRAAPQMNVLMLGFPAKILVTLSLLGLAMPLLPEAVDSLVMEAIEAMGSLGRGGGG